ncbi:FecCD family ABC transporter permease [Geoglobus ahangari]|nr:iron chelate uptake ABC transporter family permease subunit [Geoglobus ahangari]
MVHTSQGRMAKVLLVLVILLALSFLLSIGYGSSGFLLSFHDIQSKILDYRLRRTILAALVGASLSSAGCAMQSLFRNPLADPYIIGVSSGASAGASIAIVLGLASSSLSLMLFAFASSILTVYVVYRIGGSTTSSLLLAGIAVATFLTGLTSLLIYMAGESMHKVIFWIMGGFWTANWVKVGLMLFTAFLGIALLYVFAWRLNALLLGEEHAESVGIDVSKFRAVIVAISALLTASAVSVSGVIGFVGLIIPHTMRMLLGFDNRVLIPFSVLFAMGFMPLVDLVARVAVPGELPVGIITSMLGAPFFIYLLRRGTGFGA